MSQLHGDTPRYERHHRLYTVLLVQILGGFHFATLFYGERFRFWHHPYSGLGATVTENELPNRSAAVVFDTVLVCIALILIVIAIAAARDRRLPHRGVRTVFSSAASFGALIATYPHNLYPVQHALGSAFLVGSLWMLSNFFIYDVAKRGSLGTARWLAVILHTTVVSYAIAYVINADSKQIFQKFAVFGLCGVLYGATRILAGKDSKVAARSSHTASRIPDNIGRT